MRYLSLVFWKCVNMYQIVLSTIKLEETSEYKNIEDLYRKRRIKLSRSFAQFAQKCSSDWIVSFFSVDLCSSMANIVHQGRAMDWFGTLKYRICFLFLSFSWWGCPCAASFVDSFFLEISISCLGWDLSLGPTHILRVQFQICKPHVGSFFMVL